MLIVRFCACECLLMNVVREIDVSSDSDNTDSSDIDFHDSSDVCGQSLFYYSITIILFPV